MKAERKKEMEIIMTTLCKLPQTSIFLSDAFLIVKSSFVFDQSGQLLTLRSFLFMNPFYVNIH